MSIKKNQDIVNKNLYNKIKKIAKTKFKKWPSAYASSWLVKEYKRQGGKYKSKKSNNTGLTRWYAEKWIDVCQFPKIVACGREKLNSLNWKKKYPYCRPKNRISSKTPKTVKELSKYEIKKRCSIKRKSPLKILRQKSKRKSRVKSKRKSRVKSKRKSKN
jgi:hypothetical protein